MNSYSEAINDCWNPEDPWLTSFPDIFNNVVWQVCEHINDGERNDNFRNLFAAFLYTADQETIDALIKEYS